jgi:hypothetical protein
VTWDHDRFDNIQNGIDEARIHLYGQDGNTTPSGFTISNSHFGGTGLNGGTGGCSDGIGGVAQVSGVTIGPGNEFERMPQNTAAGPCANINGAHVDPIQSYVFGPGLTVTGNFFHDNGDGSGGLGFFSGSDYPLVVTENVFVCGCGYTGQAALFGTDSAVFAHNTMVAGGNLWLRVGNLGNPSTNTQIRDNVWRTGSVVADAPATYTATNNLNAAVSGTGNITAAPVFVGGANPTSYAGYRLASSSPGYHAGSDGQSMGISG